MVLTSPRAYNSNCAPHGQCLILGGLHAQMHVEFALCM